MSPRSLTEAQEQCLRTQVIDADHPGPLLRDFRTLLEYVGSQEVPAGGKYNLLPIQAIGELDARLARPLRLELKRPQLRSHPYLQGLHLLLRASGLSRVEGVGVKARLALDPAMIAQWDRLNPTEQYFTLLEAWFLIGRPEMVGERGSAFESLLWPCLLAWQRLPVKGTRYNVARPQQVYVVGIGRDHYQLALMDLFGLLAVEHPSQPVKPWCPAGLRHVPFGDALFTVLLGQEFPFLLDDVPGGEDGDEEGQPDDVPPGEEDGDEGDQPDDDDIRFGAWQPLFQPYFPEWRENLTPPETVPREGIFVFRVALGKVWRLIAIPADDTLEDLVHGILRSVGFDNDHLYEFLYRDRFGRTVEAHHPYMDEPPWTGDVRIGDLPLEPGQSMKLVYDFGDNWKFDVRLERIDPPDKKVKTPKILESQGKAPKQYGDSESW
jgi:hypothetical protein